MNDVQWIDINLILPNTKNPRRNAQVKIDEMISILKNRGWEQALTVYKSGNYYTIISGHRRWEAARKMGLTQIPVYVRPKPIDDVEEIERLGDIQRGQVDWNEYEHAEHTYQLYKKLNMSFEQLAKKLHVSSSIISARVRVYEYYPRIEIEAKLANHMYSIRMLEYIRQWMEKLKKYQPNLFESLGEKRIREILLQKYENRVINSYIHLDEYVAKAPESIVFDFLRSPNKKIVDLKRDFESLKGLNKVVNVKHNKKKIRTTKKEIEIINPRNKREAIVLKDSLEAIREQIAEKKKQLEEILKQQKKNRKGVVLK